MAALAGTVLPLERSPGLLLVTGPVPAQIRRVVCPPDLRIRPDGGGRVMVQWIPLDSAATEADPLRNDDQRVAAAMAHARGVLPALRDATVELVRLGIRPIPADGLPLVGFDPGIGNLYHVVTHSGIDAGRPPGNPCHLEELAGGEASPLGAYRPSRARSYAAG